MIYDLILTCIYLFICLFIYLHTTNPISMTTFVYNFNVKNCKEHKSFCAYQNEIIKISTIVTSAVTKIVDS